MKINVEKSSHFCIDSASPVLHVLITDNTGKAVYARRAEKHKPLYKFCVNLKAGAYTIKSDSNLHFKIKSDGNIPDWSIDLPPAQWKKAPAIVSTIITGDSKRLSPAETDVNKGIMYLNPKFFTLPFYVQEFVKHHEAGHLKYISEEFCDLYAVNEIMKKGGNLSPCLLALEIGLKRTPNNLSRTQHFFETVTHKHHG